MGKGDTQDNGLDNQRGGQPAWELAGEYPEALQDEPLYAETGGIKNVRAAYKTSPERFRDRLDDRGVAQGIYRKTVQKKARVGKKLAQDSLDEVLASESVVRQGLATQAARRMAGTAAKARKVAGVGSWGLLYPVGVAYLIQLVFGVLSLIGLGLHASVSLAVEGSWFARFVGIFVDIRRLIPGDTWGMVFWGLATLLAVAVFISCIIVFYLTAVDIFGSTLSLFIASLALALSMMPVLNLLPWLLLWVLYVKITSTASLIGDMVPTAGKLG